METYMLFEGTQNGETPEMDNTVGNKKPRNDHSDISNCIAYVPP